MTEEQLSALLRLKRYEQPPPGYFDQLLTDIHRRQRAELLRRPLWRIALERAQTFFGEHSMGGLSYAGAVAAALVVGVLTIGLMIPGNLESNPRGNRVAGQPSTAPRNAMVSLQPKPPALERREAMVSLQPTRPVLERQHFHTEQSGRVATAAPRFVIDAQPASFEPSGFKF